MFLLDVRECICDAKVESFGKFKRKRWEINKFFKKIINTGFLIISGLKLIKKVEK